MAVFRGGGGNPMVPPPLNKTLKLSPFNKLLPPPLFNIVAIQCVSNTLAVHVCRQKQCHDFSPLYTCIQTRVLSSTYPVTRAHIAQSVDLLLYAW